MLRLFADEVAHGEGTDCAHVPVGLGCTVYDAGLCSGSEAGSYLRLIYLCFWFRVVGFGVQGVPLVLHEERARLAVTPVPARESSLVTTYWSESTISS